MTFKFAWLPFYDNSYTKHKEEKLDSKFFLINILKISGREKRSFLA